MFDHLKSTATATTSPVAHDTTRQLSKSGHIFWVIWAVSSLAYVIYASTTHSGLTGYAMKLQMDLFGSASENATFLLTWIGLTAMIFPLLWVARLLAPSFFWENQDAARSFQLAVLDGVNKPLVRISWKVILIVTALPILVCSLIAALSYYSNRQDRCAGVYHVDLAARAVMPRGTRLVEVTGEVARSYAVMYKKTEDRTVTHELFVPLTSPRWNRRDEVGFVLHHETGESYDGQVNWPEPFLRRGLTHISGKIGRGLPAHVESAFRSKGIKLDSAYTVIDWKDLQHLQQPFDLQDAIVPLAGGLLISVFLFPLMVMLRFKVAHVVRTRR
jgi:hypothetical protein